MRWFLAKISYERTRDAKRGAEEYVVNAMSFSEAEGVVLRHVAGATATEPKFKALKPVDIEGIVTGDGGWYKVTAVVDPIDGETAQYRSVIYVAASSCKDAIGKARDFYHESGFDIEKVEKTKVLSVLDYRDL